MESSADVGVTKLGSGAYGSVYAIHDKRTDEVFARKQGRLGRYEATILASGAPGVPGLIAHYPAGVTPPFANAPPEEGAETLDMEPVNPFKMGPESSYRVIRFICETLIDVTARCRGRGKILQDREVVHKDIKREHIRISFEGELKLIDWGTTCLTGDVDQLHGGGMTLPNGTPGYIPPESFKGDPATTRFDSWAIGILLYGLLSSGAHPFLTKDANDLAMRTTMLIFNGPMGQRTRDSFNERVTQLAEQTRDCQLGITLVGLLQVDPTQRLSPEEALRILSTPSPKAFSPNSGSDSEGEVSSLDTTVEEVLVDSPDKEDAGRLATDTKIVV